MRQFSPADVFNGAGDGVLNPAGSYTNYPVKFLAQGDSWFLWGSIPFWNTTNILAPLNLSYDNNCCVVNCAMSGRELSSMLNWSTDISFGSLLFGHLDYKWDGILLSGGGNDLIAKLQVLPKDSHGQIVPLSQRLLLTSDEWGNPGNVSRYISDEGWNALSNAIKAEFAGLIAKRDSSVNAGKPIFFHTYDYPTPRDAGAGPGFGPWIYPAINATGYNIPIDDWNALAQELIDRLAATLNDVVQSNPGKNLHLIETTKTLTRAGSVSGISGGWENEIHPTPDGYEQIASRWKAVIEGVVHYP